MFLFRDFVIQHNSLVGVFRGIASSTIFIGIILFCIALIRSKSFPKLAGILIFIGAFLYGLGPLLSVVIPIIGIFILSIGWLILGLNLMRKQA
jgi:predicted PurR-regulated permease PerM